MEKMLSGDAVLIRRLVKCVDGGTTIIARKENVFLIDKCCARVGIIKSLIMENQMKRAKSDSE